MYNLSTTFQLSSIIRTCWGYIISSYRPIISFFINNNSSSVPAGHMHKIVTKCAKANYSLAIDSTLVLQLELFNIVPKHNTNNL